MKFTEGMWRVKEGVQLNWMGHVERLQIQDNDNVDLLLTQPQRNRGDQLNKGTVSAKVRSPLEGVIATKFTHWNGAQDSGPHLPLFEAKPNVKVDTAKDYLKYSSGQLDLRINTSPNNLEFSYNALGKRLTGHSFRSIAYVTSSNTSRYIVSDGLYAQRTNYVTLQLDLAVHEKIYGLGERFGPFIKNGQSVEVWNEDGGTSSELAYKNIPFYLSSRGYGVFINNPGKVMLEIQSERTTRVNITIEGESLEYMIITGPTPKEVLDRYTALTGRPGLPPAWSYGLWLTTSFTTSYEESTVTSFLDGFEKRNIPLSTFHFDAFWQKGLNWCDLQFDSDAFPDAPAYLARLKARGIRVCVWINPYIAQASRLFSEGKEKGYFLMRADTPTPTVWQWDNWQPGMAIIDFTNPAATKWYCSHLSRLMSIGVDAFKTDFAERIPFSAHLVKWHNGADPHGMHNFYSYLYNKAVYECMQREGKEACLFARSATSGGQMFPVHWGGDCESTFEAMAESLRGGLSLGLCGFGFWASDIGGFEGMPGPEIYKRWCQWGLLGSHSRLHGSGSYRVPWIYDQVGSKWEGKGEGERCSEVLRSAVELKLRLIPYLLRCGLEASLRGTPVMRAMLLEFPEDRNCWSVDTQYMLGSELLVAPVFDKGGEVTFYVPHTEGGGKWRSWWDWNKTYESGKWYEERHGFETLPLLVRPGAVLPTNAKMRKPEADIWDGLEVLVNGPLEQEKIIDIVEAGDVGKVSTSFTIGQDLKTEGCTARVTDLSIS